MKHIVCFSGGHSSALVAIEVVRKYGKEDVILLNHECLLEDIDVTRFENAVANYLDLPITYANMDNYDTKDQFDVVIEKRSFINTNGSSREALCTYVMKTEPFMKYLSQFNPSDITAYYGFDYDEPKRVLRRSTIMAVHGYKTAFPLFNWDRTISNTSEIGIIPPNTYNVFKHANCIGCLKAGWQHWYAVYVLYPHIYERGKLSEQEIGFSIHKDFYLEERESDFDKMIKCGIEPTEKIKPQTWWAMVRRTLKKYNETICEVSEDEYKPCECTEK